MSRATSQRHNEWGEQSLPVTGHTHRNLVIALLIFSLVWIGPILACGSFQPRPTPTPTPMATETPAPEAATVAEAEATDTPAIVVQPTPTFTPEPTPTATATPLPGTALAVGQPARVVAPGGLNIRETASTEGTLITQLGTGQRVTVVDGPVEADGYVWWRVDDAQGNVGWVAQGDGETEWLSHEIGDETQPVDRAPRVGDRVRVTMDPGGQLTVRTMPGTSSPEVTRVNAGEEFTVLAGPQSASGFIWYQIRSDDGAIQGWAADGNDTTRWLSPLE